MKPFPMYFSNASRKGRGPYRSRPNIELMKTSSISNPPRATKGFTLVEMLVTITIIAILAGMSLAGLQFVRQKQFNAQAEVQVALLSKGLEEYKLDTGDYPPSGTSNDLFLALYRDGYDYSEASDEEKKEWPSNKATVIYVPELDPKNNKQKWTTGSDATATITDPWGQEYIYRRPGDTDAVNPDFDLLSTGKDIDDPADDIKNF